MTIDALNTQIRGCTRCGLSATRVNALPGEGNLRATLFLIAQAPGEKEDREGRMFIGPSGRVLDELLAASRIQRDSLYMTNLVKCFLPAYRRPKQEEIEACSAYLEQEIKLVAPRVLAPLGYFATKHILERHAIGTPSKKEFRQVYGRLYVTENCRIFPLQHPSSVLHNPPIKDVLLKNYAKLPVLLRDCKWYPVCPLKRFYEEGTLGKEWIERYCKGDWERCIRYQMEERSEPHPDWMLPDGSLDENLKGT